MQSNLDPNEWRSIRFEGIDLPPSLMAISILIVIDDFSERTGDWIWRLPHCKGVGKDGAAKWCVDSATEIMDHLLEHRQVILAMINERLGPHGFDAELTYAEWMASLLKIRDIASGMDGDCMWTAEDPGFDAEAAAKKMLRALDAYRDSLGS